VSTLASGAVLLLASLAVWFLGAGSLEAQVRRVSPDSTRSDTLQADTIPVDSTRLRIEAQLLGLARPPGLDSVYFLPDSLLPDSLLAIKQARSGRGGASNRQQGSRAGGGALTGGDSIMTELKELEGYSITEYQSQGADFEAKERRLILLGTPESMARIVADGQSLTADSLFYSEESGKVWSVGSSASFQPQSGEPVDSRIIVFDLNQERGTALGATTKYSGGGEWIVHGDLVSVSDTATFGDQLSFTSCDLEVPHYHFASNNVKIVRGNLLVARPVKLYFADVPVAWLPFMVQNLDQGRSSGLLTPTFSINDIVRTSQNYSRRISNLGFYWAASEYWDATVFLDWWSGEHTALTGSLRYDWAKQFLGGSVAFRRFWRASGSRELAFDGNTQWEMSERTRLRFRGRYASSTSMVRETSFDPMEVVQSIDSEGGLTRRFDFGNLTMSANRKQYLSDDRVDMTLPNLSFSLSPQTFFKASPSQASFYNNITWSGSASFRRNTSDRPEQPDTAEFQVSLADYVKTDARLTTSLNLGNLSLGGGVDFSENLIKGVPVGMEQTGTLGPEVPFSIQDQSTADAGWNASLGYQQRLVGSTTLTPSLSLSNRLKRSDTDPLAQEFVSGPTRLSLGASLRTDLYGFFPGFGPFEAIRHKISPGFDFSYSPKVSPTELQREVFGASDVRAQRTLMISLNQTFEAKRTPAAAAAAAQAAAREFQPGGAPEDSLGVMARDSLALAGDSLAADSLRADSVLGPGGMPPNEQKFTLLALRTTAINYDFEKADEAGDWLWGITTTVLTNTISSDYLRGLNVTMAHDLFDDSGASAGGGEGGSGRKFSPHLSSLNFGFSLDSRSFPFKQISSLLSRGSSTADSIANVGQPMGESQDNPFAPSLTDEATVVPVGGDPSPRIRGRGGMGGAAGNWRANLRFSMQRPRSKDQRSNQMLQGDLTFSLTENWDASWRTSYDLLAGAFNDHYIQLTRNLHRWEAHFDFSKTATGNWSFRFEVALMDQEDLHFDYAQRSYQDRAGGTRY